MEIARRLACPYDVVGSSDAAMPSKSAAISQYREYTRKTQSVRFRASRVCLCIFWQYGKRVSLLSRWLYCIVSLTLYLLGDYTELSYCATNKVEAQTASVLLCVDKENHNKRTEVLFSRYWAVRIANYECELRGTGCAAQRLAAFAMSPPSVRWFSRKRTVREQRLHNAIGVFDP